ncbi:MAG: restriction endonuclease, partial [Armatimonadetes bacterium]|nr:restriction endonuclease [Armatimonadota bacterium]NIM23376.1 restriction endonuclease [Armatimonadota bacterium]NIM67240.1 restriction endonuclease [Armatimonadota bacterium]NIN05427.1 restriction endonuclease [Armatimonadota bacterium]NIO96639.1 restriction endonuclease [Armatimonadota bacterium]
MKIRVPFEVREALVTVCGRSFHYKDLFRDFLISSDVPAHVYDRYSEESKFKIARHILGELDSMGDEGYRIQRRIITNLCNLRKLPDENAPDRNAAVAALQKLKQLALDQKLVVEQEQDAKQERIREARRKQEAIAARASKTQQLRERFLQLSLSDDAPQSRGYSLEQILV